MCHASPYCLILLNITCSYNLAKFLVGDNEAMTVHLIWAGIELCIQDLIICRPNAPFSIATIFVCVLLKRFHQHFEVSSVVLAGLSTC